MKNTYKFLALIALIALVSFAFTTDHIDRKEIKADASNVIWKGYKVTGSHHGTLDIESGFLSFDHGVLVGGSITMNMASLKNADLEGEYKGKLENHLKSDDFFGVEKHPNSTLVITNVKSTGKNSYAATGDLSIKGITNSVSFVVSIYGQKANATLKIDRSKYDVKYGSTSFFDDLKDKAIYDEFDIIADLEF